MRKFKVNNKYVVTANTHDQAISIVKSVKAKDADTMPFFNEMLEFDRTTKCDWCGKKARTAITHFGTQPYYNRLICKECAKDIVKQYRKDSINDSTASDIVKEIKKAYPNIEIHQTAKSGIATLNFYGYEKDANWKKFLDYLARKYNIEKDAYSKSYMLIFNNTKDSIDEPIEDDEESDIMMLSEEEEKAIEDYRKAISNTRDPKLLKLFGHILKEEVEHLEELQSGETEDSIDDAPDFLTPSGRKDIYMQIAMSALDNIPTRMWNIKGDKISIDNNFIVLVVTDKGIVWKQESGKPIVFTDKKTLEKSLLQVLG